MSPQKFTRAGGGKAFLISGPLRLLCYAFLLSSFQVQAAQAVRAEELLAPDASNLKPFLQAWFSAEALSLNDSAPVYRWPDRSGNHRDAFPTQGSLHGAGTPPVYVKAGTVNGRPAVRFDQNNGLGTPGDNPVQMSGDVAFTMIFIANLRRNEQPGATDVLVGFGEPIDSANGTPGRPAAALLQIDRGSIGQHRLDHAGGFARDALIGHPGSFASFYELPQMITLIKTPGSMRDTSAIFINGEPIDTFPASGTSAAPDLRQRSDFSILIGHAFEQTGSILGDVSEVLIYNTALSPQERRSLEMLFSKKYQIPAGPAAPPEDLVDANQRRHWAYAKAHRPPVPKLTAPGTEKLARTAIDLFLLAKLEEKGLSFSPEAPKETLARRLALDLTGLPPSLEQVEEFLSDASSTAYERLIEQLIASPHFGERWGRHWLDQAGYVDVNGNDQNAEQIILGESKWKYRDYVIRAFNSDKPFDQFLREQIAGDELVDWRHAEYYSPEIKEKLIATGYLRLAIDDTHEVDLNKVPFRYQVLFDTMQLIGNSLFGMTLQCARCHNHKFDPIPQSDYYRVMGLFTPTFNPHNWLQPKDRELAGVSSAEQAAITAHNAEIDSRLSPVQEELAKILISATNRVLESILKELPEKQRAEIIQAFAKPPEKRPDQEKALLKSNEANLAKVQNAVNGARSPDERSKAASLEKRISDLNKQRKHWDTIRAFFENGVPPPDYLFLRGDHERRGQRVGPGFLTALCDSAEDSRLPVGLPSSTSSGRRLAFVNWLTNPEGRPAALTARVIVNRFWQQLFGEGIVPTQDNFGINGSPPSHPELLEWLAANFIDSGWRVKPLIKMMVMSAAYRQSSTVAQHTDAPNPLNVDPENKLLWRMRLRRLESEIIRDSILAVSGTLNPKMLGPAVPLQTLADGSIALVADDKLPTLSSKYRRSIYLMTRRNFHLPILGSFDQPIINNSCPRRMSSSVVLQSLTMLNDPFILEQAATFAQRLQQLCPQDENARIERAFRLIFARTPGADELAWSKSFISDQTANFASSGCESEKARQEAFATFCQMLLNTSEFLYVQ